MTVQIKDKTLTLPDSWNECDTKQRIMIYTILMMDNDPILTDVEILPTQRILILQQLTGWDRFFLNRLKNTLQQVHGIEGGELMFNTMLLEASTEVAAPYLEVSESGSYSMSFTLTQCPFPEIQYKHRGRRRSIFAPADGLDNLTIYELCIAFTLFENYLAEPGPKTADVLLATLYRPPKPATAENRARAYEGDRRIPYQGYEATVTGRIQRVKDLPAITKQLILFWFASCRHAIIAAYPNLFDTTGNKAEKVGNDYGWGGLLISLAGGLADLNTIGQQSWQNAFTYLSYLEDQRKTAEMRAAAAKARAK